MTCSCISDINEKLDGQRLETHISLSLDLRTMSDRTATILERIDTGKRETRRSKPRLVVHKFCPFCGDRYDQTKVIAA